MDVFRNLPLILLILFLALSLPDAWRDAWEDDVAGWAPEAFESGLVLAALVGLIALQQRGPRGDHARGHPLAPARAGRGRPPRSG